MKKLIYVAMALTMGTVAFTSCNDKKDDTPSQVKVQFQDQTNQYKYIARVVKITSGKDAAQGPELSAIIGVISPKLAPGSSFAEDVRNECKDWAKNWATWVVAPATEGHGGLLPKGGNEKKMVAVNNNGIELAQLYKKGFIGAYTFANVVSLINKIGNGMDNANVYQNVVAYYLGSYDYLNMPEVEKTVEGQKIKAYQYDTNCEFAKYVNSVNNMEAGKGLGDQFIQKLKEAGTMLNDNGALKAKLLEAQMLAQKIIMVRCTFYLKSGGNKFNDGGIKNAFHNTSEGLGFVYAMQFSINENGQPYLSRDEVLGYLKDINMWNQQDAQPKMEALKNKLEKMFGIDDSLQPNEE